mgnify:FL=1
MAKRLDEAFRFGPRGQAVLWLALVAVGICGRLWQPTYNVTPLAAIALAAGTVLSSRLAAAAVPLASVMLSNLALSPYDSPLMAAVVYAALAWPVLLGGLIRRQGWLAVIGGSLASSLVFFLVTNAAHWAVTQQYPHSPEGLLACFTAALPFYRWMPVGDLAWSLAVFGGLVAAARLRQQFSPTRLAPVVVQRQPQSERGTQSLD